MASSGPADGPPLVQALSQEDSVSAFVKTIVSYSSYRMPNKNLEEDS